MGILRPAAVAMAVAFLRLSAAEAQSGPAAEPAAASDQQVPHGPTGKDSNSVGSTIFVPEAELVGQGDPIGVAGAAAGFSVSVDGDTALIGAPYSNNHTGAAYVFVRTGGIWIEQQELVASDGSFDDFFGYSVSLWQDTALITRLPDTGGGGPWEPGAAYVFVRSGGVWSEQQKLTNSGGNSFFFGGSGSVSGDTAIVGMQLGGGAAFVFVRAAGVWTQQQMLTPSDGPVDSFGSAVALNGDTVVVGAPLDDTAGGQDSGSAYVFFRSGAAWNEQQKLTPSDGAGNDNFGTSVAISGDTAVVGSPLADTADVDAGSAYVFVRSATTWTGQRS